jgi:hypothetical protein
MLKRYSCQLQRECGETQHLVRLLPATALRYKLDADRERRVGNSSSVYDCCVKRSSAESINVAKTVKRVNFDDTAN